MTEIDTDKAAAICCQMVEHTNTSHLDQDKVYHLLDENVQSRCISFFKTPPRYGALSGNVYYTTSTVATCLAHPEKGKTQPFRRNCSFEQLCDVFDDPRVHTGRGYHRSHELAGKKGFLSGHSSVMEELEVRRELHEIDAKLRQLELCRTKLLTHIWDCENEREKFVAAKLKKEEEQRLRRHKLQGRYYDIEHSNVARDKLLSLFQQGELGPVEYVAVWSQGFFLALKDGTTHSYCLPDGFAKSLGPNSTLKYIVLVPMSSTMLSSKMENLAGPLA